MGHWGPKALCLPLALTPASCLQLTQIVCALVILLFNVHLLPLFFRLFTQVHLLIDGSVQGQSITNPATQRDRIQKLHRLFIYWGSRTWNSYFPVSYVTSGNHPSPSSFRWKIESSDTTKFYWFLLRVLDQVDLVTSNPFDEMLNFVNSSYSCRHFLLLTYTLIPVSFTYNVKVYHHQEISFSTSGNIKDNSSL